jgi:hypothetical protein
MERGDICGIKELAQFKTPPEKRHPPGKRRMSSFGNGVKPEADG